MRTQHKFDFTPDGSHKYIQRQVNVTYMLSDLPEYLRKRIKLEACKNERVSVSMVHSGELSLEPTALQEFLRQRRNGSNGSNGLQAITEEHAGQPWSQVKAGKRKP